MIDHPYSAVMRRLLRYCAENRLAEYECRRIVPNLDRLVDRLTSLESAADFRTRRIGHLLSAVANRAARRFWKERHPG